MVDTCNHGVPVHHKCLICNGMEETDSTEVIQLRAQLAAEIEEREKAELKLEQIGNLKANEKLLALWDSIDTGECENNGCIDARLALQKSEAEKVELAVAYLSLRDRFDRTMVSMGGRGFGKSLMDEMYAKAKAIIERGK